MRPIVKSVPALCALLAVLSLSAAARAQDTRPRAATPARTVDDRNVTYEFLDDPLAGGGIVPRGGVVTIRTRRMQTLLIRPRTQFVTEMLKSVENL